MCTLSDTASFDRKVLAIIMNLPPISLTVAYRELASGQLALLQRPVALYSFLQKFWPTALLWEWPPPGAALILYEQNWWFLWWHSDS